MAILDVRAAKNSMATCILTVSLQVIRNIVGVETDNTYYKNLNGIIEYNFNPSRISNVLLNHQSILSKEALGRRDYA